jgi:hypothetical protein
MAYNKGYTTKHVIQEALNKARSREKESDAFHFCLEFFVCPECAGDLVHGSSGELALPDLSCTSCDFKY